MRTSFAIRQPLILRAAIALILLGLVRLLAWAGWIPADWGLVNLVNIEQFIDTAILGLTWWSTHRVVTPVANPRDSQGNPLTPAGSGPRSL